MTHPSLRQFLLTPPQQLAQAKAWGLPLAHMAYRLDETGQLRQTALPGETKGGLMLVGADETPVGRSDPRRAVREILAVCQARNYGGVILDIEQPPTHFLAQLIQGLEEGLSLRRRTLFLPETYASYSHRASLYFSSALSGGSLQRRLETAADTYGPHRLVLCLRRARDDFFLPSVKGRGRPISQETLDRLIQRMHPSIFFSQDLCTHYFTYMSRETGAHFVLFDDGESLAKKRAIAQEIGVTRFFLLYPEIEEFLPHLTGRNVEQDASATG